ncbi:NB-ARC domain-containing protein [Streptomyces sp. GESEQ-35]|uniref:NB-ARC domain-containing protein n=1 Tax=Streptomyces sp. GESEQ-35 TaxID=2812657 RepID=UPI001B342C14|nr:NB-ARC domain-containing protein [Streptomyces sp. GESEQ-35]
MHVERATMLPAEAFGMAPCASRVCHLPYRTDQFVGRERQLGLLDESFGDTGGVVVHAIHGLGGIGKSTLAARWASERTADFNPIWWITAETPVELDAGLAALGRALQPALVDVLTEDAFRERTIQWLSANDGWLLVLDNVSAPADIKPLLARVTRGRCLITTRRGATSWRGIARTVDLDVLEPAESVELFTKIYDGDRYGVEELCAELGCLPLAIDQAAAYCREAEITPRAYLDLLARHPAEMYAATAEDGDARRTLARVWQVTLDRLADCPLAVEMLRTVGWWAPDDIPRAYLDHLGGPVEVTEAIRRLAAHSMVKVRGELLSVHRLVQAVTRAGDRETMAERREAAAALLIEVWPTTHLFGEAERLWAGHADALSNCMDGEFDTERVTLLLTMASGHLARANRERSVALIERALAAVERNPSWECSDIVRGQVLPVYVINGYMNRAQPLLEADLAQKRERLGAFHPETFMARRMLALALQGSAPEQARDLRRLIVEDAMTALGADHPVTFESRMELRRGASSEPSDRQVIEARIAEAVRILGQDSWTVTTLEQQLLTALRKSGDLGEAVELAEKVVGKYRALLGDRDAQTVAVRSEQCGILVEAGDLRRAVELMPALTADLARVAGDTPEARDLVRRVKAILQRIAK